MMATDSTGAVIPVGYDAIVPTKDAAATPPRNDGAAVLRVRVRPRGANPVPRAGDVDLSRGLWGR